MVCATVQPIYEMTQKVVAIVDELNFGMGYFIIH